MSALSRDNWLGVASDNRGYVAYSGRIRDGDPINQAGTGDAMSIGAAASAGRRGACGDDGGMPAEAGVALPEKIPGVAGRVRRRT